MSVMSDILEKNSLLSSKEAGKLLGYTHDYISKLCREGKMNGTQKGRAWYVTEEEVFAFKERHEEELNQKKAELSQKFSEMRSKHESERIVSGDQIEETKEKIQEITKESPKEKTYTPTKVLLPKQFVVAGVLALLLTMPSFLNSIPGPTSQTAQVSATGHASDVIEIFDGGVTSVIYMQSALVSETLNTYSFIQYLKDGYWELAVNFGKLSQGFYSFLDSISTGYLTFYLMQGEVVYSSILQTQSMGAHVLKGYELLGESMIIGTANVTQAYEEILQINSNSESAKKKLNKFTFDTKEGYEYAKTQSANTLGTVLREGIVGGFVSVIYNIRSNTSQMTQTFSKTSGLVTASIVNLFSFNFDKNQGGAIKVELDN